MFRVVSALPGRRKAISFVRSMFIRVEETPNPKTLKFLPGTKILNEPRTYDFTSISSAKQLLQIHGVKAVFFGEDFVTVTKASDDEEWALIKPDVFATLMDFLNSGRSIITEGAANQPSDTTITEDDDDTVAMIKELLESRIKPMVQEDGGDVLYMGFEDGVVKLKMQGSCTGCPSSAVTLKSGIKNMMQFYVPEVKDVVEVKNEEDHLVEAHFKQVEERIKSDK